LYKITITEGSGDCECCGWYGWHNIVVILNGIEVDRHYGDEHLNFTDYHDADSFVKGYVKALELLNYEVEVEQIDGNFYS